MSDTSLVGSNAAFFLTSDETNREEFEALISELGSESRGVPEKELPETSHEEQELSDEAVGVPVVEASNADADGLGEAFKKARKAKPFLCPKCPATFDKKIPLKEHLLAHENEKPFKCGECGDTFLVAENLEIHQFVHELEKGDESVLSAEEREKCIRCGAKFKRVAGMKSHLVTKHFVDEIFKCEVCEKEFVEPSELKAHREKHAKSAKRAKPLLPVNQDLPKEVKKARNIFLKTFAKPKKKKVLQSRRGKKRKAVEVFEKRAKHICQYCGKDFDKAAVLERHLRVHTREKPFKCDQCDRNFSQKSSLNRHIELHTGNKKYDCPFCQFKAAFKKNVELHIRRLHWHMIGERKLGLPSTQGTTALPQLKCPHCPCVFQRLSCLSVHQKKVHNDANFPRPNDDEDEVELNRRKNADVLERAVAACGLDPAFLAEDQQLVFETKNSDGTVERYTLQIPADTQPVSSKPTPAPRNNPQKAKVLTSADGLTNDRPHRCEECGAAFRNIGHLKDHVDQIHKKIPSIEFACRICGKLFISRSSMASHMQNHEPEDKHRCEVCSKTFKFRNTYKRHALLHKNGSTFLCHYCNRSFKSSDACKKHTELKCGRAPHRLLREGPKQEQLDAVGDDLVLLPAGHEGGEPVFLFLPHGEENQAGTIVVPGQSETDNGRVVIMDGQMPVVFPSPEEPETTVIDLNRCFVLPNKDGGMTLLVPQPDMTLEELHQPQEALEEKIETLVVTNMQDVDDPPIIVEEGLEKMLEEQEDHVVVMEAVEVPAEIVGASEFATEETFPEHMFAKPTTYICDHCNREFKKRSDFMRHLKVHSGEKPFECHACHKKFATSYNLASHMIVHMASRKKVPCLKCDKLFASKSSLNLHMRIHDGVRPFGCHICGQRYRTSGHLSSHMKTRHSHEDAQATTHPKDASLPLKLDVDSPVSPPAPFELFSKLTDQNSPPSEVLVGSDADVGDIASSMVQTQPPGMDLDTLVNFHPSDDLELGNPGFAFVSVP